MIAATPIRLIRQGTKLGLALSALLIFAQIIPSRGSVTENSGYDSLINTLVIARGQKLDVRGSIVRYLIIEIGAGEYYQGQVSLYVSSMVHDVDALPEDAILVIVPNRAYSYEDLHTLAAPVYRPIGHDPEKGVIEFSETLWNSLLAVSPDTLVETLEHERINVEAAVEIGREAVAQARAGYDVVPSFEVPTRIEHAWKLYYLVLKDGDIATIDVLHVSDQGNVVEYNPVMY